MGKTMNSFLTWEEAFKKESEERLNTDFSKLCNYGIKPLDDALFCIGKGELVVVGADSGIGKTEIAIQIASHNAKQGKKVALYHLEGGYREAVARMKWKDICQEYYKNTGGNWIDMDYRKWSVNYQQDKILTELEAKIWTQYKESYRDNLFIYHSDGDLTLTQFLSSLLDFHSLETAAGAYYKQDQRTKGFDLDLIVIDHLQYFSLEQEESEIAEITNILRQVKKVTDNYRIPVVLISHLRKKSKDRGLPDQQDFYGSSNIPKISNTSITITPKINAEDFHNQIYPTWFRIVKSRIGVRSSLAMLAEFDGKKKEYFDKYSVYKINSEGYSSNDPMPESELPKWAKGNTKIAKSEYTNWQDK